MDTNVYFEVAKLVLAGLAAGVCALLLFYIPKGVRFVEKRFSMDISPAAEERAIALAKQALGYAEEKSLQWFKKKSERIPSSEKLDVAAVYFRDNASGVAIGWTEDRVRDFIEAQLGYNRVSRGETPPPDENGGAPAGDA